MLNSDEVVPDEADDEPEVKDFAYYAELAEGWLYEAEMFTPQIYNPRKFEHAMMSADVFARLAAAAPDAPEPAAQRIELHDAACPCVKK